MKLSDTELLMISGAAAVLLLAWWVKGKGQDFASSNLGAALSSPIDNLSALLKTDVQIQADINASKGDSGLALTPGFQDYLNSQGGVDAYIAAHKNGTFNGPAYTTTPKVAQPIDMFKTTTWNLRDWLTSY